MCGICGIYEYARSDAATLDSIHAMTAALEHRGPDSGGTWTRDRLALGHRRLSIFDLTSAGDQPMHSPDGQIVVVLNGEIYNFPELRTELERDGARFRTRTDTEVLIAQYARHGIDGLAGLRGMFAFALWDARQSRLYVVRDRLGVKPLYWAMRDGVLVFASELKSLLRHPLVRPVLARERLAEWLALRYTVAPGTLFRGIHKLEPGHYLAVDGSGLRQVRYWDAVPGHTAATREEAVAGYARLFTESVRLRLRADVPVGVFLSGGLDSSAVALEAAASVSHPLRTFTVGYARNHGISELARAREVASFLGTDHHELLLDDVRADLLDDVVWHMEEPLGDPATVLLYQLAEFTRRHVTVVLSGEGSDETNLGYGKALAFQRWADLRQRPGGALLARAWLRRNAPGAVRRLARTPDADIYAELSWPGARERAADAGDAGHGWTDGLAAVLPAPAVQDALGRMLYLDLKTWLPDDLLLKVDKTTMAHALEARVPFLDHVLVEYNLGLPAAWKIGRRGTKQLLRDAVRGRLPAGAVDGAQHGFIAPVMDWLGGAWQPLLDAVLDPRQGARVRRLFAPELFTSLQRGLDRGQDRSAVLAFMLVSLERWLHVFDVEIES